MEKCSNIRLIPPCNTYGDILSIIALVNYLLEFYHNVYVFFYRPVPNVYNYYLNFYSKNLLINKRIFIKYDNDIINMLNKSNYDDFHICNTHTGSWKHHLNNYILFNYTLGDNKKIDKSHYFCDSNPLYTFHIINDNDICKPNLMLPLTSIETNSTIYYKMVGLNNNVRMNYFFYERDYEKEKQIKNMILNKFNLKNDDKYNIVNTIGSQGEFIDINRIKKHIKNNYTCIDINNLIDFSGWLFLLIEDSEELHLVEGLNVNLIYYSQYKNIINTKDKQVYIHVWARNRRWIEYKLDYSWKMFDNPKLPNWNFIHSE